MAAFWLWGHRLRVTALFPISSQYAGSNQISGTRRTLGESPVNDCLCRQEDWRYYADIANDYS